MTGMALAVVLVFAVALSKAFGDHPSDLPRARQDQCRSHRPADRIAGRRARGEGLSRRGAREASVFAAGVQRLLDNVLKSLTATSLMSLSATVLMGVVGAMVMYLGRAADPRRHDDAGRAS